ncbi:MAG: LLM class F420-dependent oxidoreductase [Actinomycetota bacterium]
MRLGLDVSQHQLTWDEIVARTQFAEEAGFDGAWVFDHFTALYSDPKGPCLEGWTLLAGLAACTSRVRLGTLVTGMTYRHPSVLAAEAVTVDHISGGRVELAVGAAWHEPEHRRLGIPFPGVRERAERLEEGVRVMRALMTSDNASLNGSHYSLEAAWYNPKPVQKPHPPIWIGANGERLMLPVVGRVADAWHGFGDAETIKRKSAIIDEHAVRAGRDPATILRSAQLSLSQPWDAVRKSAHAMREAGITYLTVGWPGEGRAHLDEFVATVMPEIVAL